MTKAGNPNQRLLALFAAIALLVLAGGVPEAQSRSIPDWIKEALEEAPSAFEPGAPYVVLLDERTTRVDHRGRAETRSRHVVRVLTREGRAAARREIQYDSQTRISSLHAWHVRTDQRVFRLSPDRVTEHSLSGDDLYSDIRSRVMRFGEADVGSVVAFEWVQKERPLVNQDYHFFQTRSPVSVSRYRLQVPAGWRVEYSFFNHERVHPVNVDGVLVWELRNLPGIKDESWMPEITSLSPYLAVTYFPDRGAAARRVVSSWEDVSTWAHELMERRIKTESLLSARARVLVDGLVNESERLQTIAQWVQKNIRYVSIQLGAVGGYRPNPADVVLRKGYGDCKDKSVLMREILRLAGIESYVVLVYSGDSTRVRPEFPSPLQFNHAIIGVRVSEDRPGSLDLPGIGRLLFFDPTDETTPLGDLPFYLQGSYGLLVTAEGGRLVRLPVREEEANTLRRDIDLDVRSTGEVIATVSETFTGQLASMARHRLAKSGESEAGRDLSTRIARDVPGAHIADLSIVGRASPEEPLKLGYTVSANNYASRLGRLLVIRPVMWAPNHPLFAKPEREHPVRFEMGSVHEDSIRITLPRGFRLDEIPPISETRTDFGEFRLTYEVKGGEVLVRRRLAVRARWIPVSGYPEVKRFFDLVHSASQASIVLVNE